MGDIEFFAKLEPKRFTSNGEDWKVGQKQFFEDERRNSLKRAIELTAEPVEVTYERFPEES